MASDATQELAVLSDPRRQDTDTGRVDSPAASTAPPRRFVDRLLDQARVFGPALLGYFAVRAIGVICLGVWAAHRGNDLSVLLAHRSDSVWYIGLIQHGYDNGHGQSNMAFFPLYPMLVRTLAVVSPAGTWWTAVAVAWLASLAAAAGVYKVGEHVRDRRTGILLAVLWGVIPHGIVESLAYTEALFTALAAWSLYALLTRRWLTSGVLCLLAGLTRPTASALIAVVGLAAVIAIVRRQDGWRPWIAMVLAPAGWIGYLAWVAHRTGRLDGWFHIQNAGWHMSWDNGAYTASTFGRLLDKPQPLDSYLVALVLVVAIALLALMISDRLPWPIVVYCALVVVISLGAENYFNARARFLIPAFGLLIPVAAGMARASRATVWTVLTALTVISTWCGGYLLLVWQFSP